MIKLKFVYGILPAVVIKTRLMQKRCRARTNAFVVRIHPTEIEELEYVTQHELQHVKQWYKTLSTHGWLYLLSKKYRLWAEVTAHKAGMKNVSKEQQKIKNEEFAELMIEEYEFKLTKKEALDMLQ